MVFAASPKVVRKLSSVIGVRAKPTMAYRDRRALWVGRSYIAGVTLRFARSPDAPKRTTVQGSATPPYTEPERPVSPAIVSPFIAFRPVQAKNATPKTIPQRHIFQAPSAIVPHFGGESHSSPGAAGFPDSAYGHRCRDTAPAVAL